MKAQVTSEGIKATPPLTVTALSWLQGWTWADLLTICSIGYVMLQSGFLIWQWRQKIKRMENGAAQ